MKRINANPIQPTLEPTLYNSICPENFVAWGLILHGTSNEYKGVNPEIAAKTSELCKFIKQVNESSDQVQKYWKWHVCHLSDVNEKSYDNSVEGIWKDLFITKSNEIQKIALKCQNHLKIEEDLRKPGCFNFEISNFLENEKQEILSSILPYRVYLSKPNANAKVQYFLYKYLQREASSEAFNFCKLAADQGHIVALLETAECYEQGRLFGVVKNLKEAVNYYKQGADQGNYHALYKMGEFHENGNYEGIKQTYIEAFKLYKIAAINGNSNAQVKVAEFHFSAMKIDREKPLKHIRKAFEYYKLAADQESKIAKYAIAHTLYPLCFEVEPETYELAIKPLHDFLYKPFFD